MSAWFPSNPEMEWKYVSVGGLGYPEIVAARVGPRCEVVLEDPATDRMFTVKAIRLETDGPRAVYAVEREGGIQFARETLATRDRMGLAAVQDFRWAGAACWSLSLRHYGLETHPCRRVGEEWVYVPAGKFRGLRIEVGDPVWEVAWLAEGVGLVRDVARVPGIDRWTTMELCAFRGSAWKR